jgi:hypothetical protein
LLFGSIVRIFCFLVVATNLEKKLSGR